MFWKRKQRELEAAPEGQTEGWERELIRQMVAASLTEQRRARRWGILFKLLLFIYLFAVLALVTQDDWLERLSGAADHTAVVDVKGLIAPGRPAAADKIIEGLRDAFKDKHTKGVILRINSPGGSPVQAGYVYDEIRRLRKKHKDIPLYAVIADVGASGAYYMAAAADAIYADKASIVGSIGVLMNGFGFVGTMKELGVERRLLTAGEHKGMLDPFSPLKAQDEEYVKVLLERLHQQFIAAVKQGRKGKLKDDPRIFSGLFWSGQEARELGLVDGLGSSGYVAREVIKCEKMVDYTPKEAWLKRVAEGVGASAGETLASLLGLGPLPSLR
jgi:protease IV